MRVGAAGRRVDAPAWLAPKLQPGETVRYVHEPGAEAWRPALVGVGVWAWLTFYVGFSRPEWWQFLPIWPEHVVSPWVSAIVGGLLFLGDAGKRILDTRYTAYAVTDQRLLRVGLDHPLAGVMPPRTDAWPLARVRVIERDKDKRRPRVRVQIERPDGKREARFRVRPRDAGAFVAALTPVATA